MVKVAINGICGRMGRRILRLAQAKETIEVVVGFEQKDHSDLGVRVEGVQVTDSFESLIKSDVVIDFTAPEATAIVLEQVKKVKRSIVVGTTGLNKEQEFLIKEAAREIPVVYSPNMSVGINLFFKVLKVAASTLSKYRIQIEEAHHVHKKDAPSGTAKKLAQIINDSGAEVKAEDILAKREGEIIGDHEVVFESDLDSFKISHHAKTRDIFAQGALAAAEWIKGKPVGLYSMEDVLFDKI